MISVCQSPSVLFLHLFQKRTFGISSTGVFTIQMVFLSPNQQYLSQDQKYTSTEVVQHSALLVCMCLKSEFGSLNVPGNGIGEYRHSRHNFLLMFYTSFWLYLYGLSDTSALLCAIFQHPFYLMPPMKKTQSPTFFSGTWSNPIQSNSRKEGLFNRN